MKTMQPVTPSTLLTMKAMRTNIFRMIAKDRRKAETERAWYRRAYKWARLLSERSGLSIELIAAVTAALSPNTEWRDNRRMVLALIRNANADTYLNRKGNRVRFGGYGFNVRKARLMMATKNPDLLSGPKVERFRDAILGIDACVVDIHATNIAMGTVNVYSGPSKAAYSMIEEAYREVAKMMGWQVCEVQSATWVIYKATK